MGDSYTSCQKTMYCYTVFGLRLDSELILPELREANDAQPADITIYFGNVPAYIAAPHWETAFFQAAAGSFLFRVADVAAFYITQGREVVVQLEECAKYDIVRLYFLGTVLAVVMMQRGVIPIHGSTVLVDGQGVLFTGLPGAGKSTMAAALRQQGYALVTDDVSVIHRDATGVYWVQPSYPQQKLGQTSCAMLGIDPQGYATIPDKRHKCILPLDQDFCLHPVPLALVYEVIPASCRQISFITLRGLEKMAVIMRNAFRLELIEVVGVKREHFEQSAGLSQQASICRLIRPEHGMMFSEQCELVVKHCLDNIKNKEKCR